MNKKEKKKIAFAFMILFGIIFFYGISLINSGELDKVIDNKFSKVALTKNYDKSLETVTFKDSNNYQLGKAKLMFNTYSCGGNIPCYAVIKITDYKSSNNILSDLRFSDIKQNKDKNISYNIQINQGNGYKEYNQETQLSGDFLIKITANKQINDLIDWIPTIYGLEVKEWAIWGNSYDYDTFTGAVINNTLWNNRTTGVGGTTTKNGYIEAGASTTNGNVGTTEIYTSLFPNLISIKNITTIVDLNAVYGTSCVTNRVNLEAFGNVIKQINCQGQNTSTWTFIKNNTDNTKFEVYANGTHISQIGYTNNNISLIILWESGSPGNINDYARIYSLSYVYDNNTAMGITLNSPVNNFKSYHLDSVLFNTTSSVYINYLSNTSLYINGILNETKTITGQSNETLFNKSLAIGNYTWYIKTCDDSNNCKDSQVNNLYMNPFRENSVTYNTLAYETSIQNFILNLTLPFNPISINGILNYNNQNYTSTASCNGINCIISNDIDIPLVSTSSNKTFYWIVDYYNASSQFTGNTIQYNQTINQINVYNCTSGTIGLNFATIDETTLIPMNLFNFSASFNYWLGSGTTYRNLSFSSFNINNQSICINQSENFFTDADIQFGASGYVNNEYFLNNESLNNITNYINLYLLNTADATSFIDEVLDTGRNPIVDAYIYIQRCYPGVCNTVQVIKTDNTGRSIGFYKTDTIDYQHIIIKDGVVIYQDSPHKIFATTAPYTNTFYIGSGNSINFNYTLPNLYESLTYNETNKLVTYTYIDTSSTFTQGRLLVELTNYSGNNGIICNLTSIQSSATITCDLSTSPEANYEASGFIKRGSTENLVDYIRFTLVNAKEIFGLAGLFLGFLIILTAGMAFLYHPIAGTWMVTIAMIFTNLIGFTSFTMIWIFGAVILSIIFTWFFRE